MNSVAQALLDPSNFGKLCAGAKLIIASLPLTHPRLLLRQSTSQPRSPVAVARPMWEMSHPPRPANRIAVAGAAVGFFETGGGRAGRCVGGCPPAARRARRDGSSPPPPDENVFFRSPCFPWESADLIIGERGERKVNVEFSLASTLEKGKTKLFMSSPPSQEIGGKYVRTS